MKLRSASLRSVPDAKSLRTVLVIVRKLTGKATPNFVCPPVVTTKLNHLAVFMPNPVNLFVQVSADSERESELFDQISGNGIATLR